MTDALPVRLLLVETPQFYHTVFANCTTIVFDMVRAIVPGLPIDWRLLASGYLPQYVDSVKALLDATH